MKRYRKLNGSSGVMAFEIGDEFIKVQFVDGSVYLYDYASAGRRNIEKMKVLAMAGKGLSTFISQHVRNAYSSRVE